MTIAVLIPRYDHAAIEERYASWQAQLLLRGPGARLYFYDAGERADDVVHAVQEQLSLVVTDPLLLATSTLPERLAALLESSGASAVLPVTNETANEVQHCAPGAAYLTLREFQLMAAAWQQRPADPIRVTWDGSDPAAYLCKTELLDHSKKPLRSALEGLKVVVSPADYVHRWSTMRGQVRQDLLDRIGPAARSLLEFGCGEGVLGEAVKKRQRCRVVGVELDREAAAIARRRLDDVYCADVREIVSILDERFDWIVGGDIVEHLDDPWSFLAELRGLSAPGGHLLLSLPNLANASMVSDLLNGRFDYVYMGLACAGHLRFFTRRTIEDMLSVAGWQVAAIEPQQIATSPQGAELLAKLSAAGIEHCADDLNATGYYVTARNG